LANVFCIKAILRLATKNCFCESSQRLIQPRLVRWAWAQNARAYNVKLIEFAAINASSVFNYAQKLSRAHSPQEFADVVTNHVRDQFESLTEQTEELSALAQKATSKDEDATEIAFGE
jgi:hypothetical protein